jgi:MraZ protein
MFVGRYEVRLDAKHRVTVPQKMRQSHADGGPVWSEFYLTLGAEGCIFVYTPEGWERMMEAMGATQPIADGSLRMLQRLVAANAVRCELDSQSRIVLPRVLRSHANLKRDVLWIGAVGRAEIWDAESWKAYQEQHIDELGDKLDLVARAGVILPKETRPERP